MFREFVERYREGLRECFEELAVEKLERVAEILLRAQREGRKVFFLGNGGSASTASHMAVDFGKGTAVRGQPRLRAISLTDNIGLITAWANDAAYESVFQEQLDNLLEPQDVVVGISASGNSANVLRAVEFARQRGAVTIGLIGFGGGKLKDLVDVDITVSSRNYGQIEDFHLSLDHILSQYLKEKSELQLPEEMAAKHGEQHLKFFYSTPPATGIQPAVFFDRDGVINERIYGGYIGGWDQFHFLDGIKSAMASLSKLNLPIIVVSNQASVGRSLLSPATLREITERFVKALQEAGARVSAVYYCPHTPEQGCGCRKPRSGLLEAAARDWRIDLRRSVLIGDSESDVQAARALGCHAILFAARNGQGDARAETEHSALEFQSVRNASELEACVRGILSAPVGRV
jgi:D-sedoheptulose 7-phosphate isomerase